MSNVEVWQYFVIGGPAFMVGCVASWLCLKDYIAGLEEMVLADKPEPRSSEEIARHLLENL